MKTIISIGAHHDDVELRSGGTLAKYVARGWRVVYAVATTTPHYSPWPEEERSGRYRSNNEIIALRKEEATRGAQALGISEVHFLDFKSLYWYKEGTVERLRPDGIQCTSRELRYLEEEIPGREFIVHAHFVPAAVSFLRDFLRRHHADIVLTHGPDDGHYEHYATSRFVFQAVRGLADEGRKIRCFAWEPGGADSLVNGFAPTHFVDIAETIDLKCKALEGFRSQFADHDTSYFVERARARAKAYGAIAGLEYAEPFMRFKHDVQGAGMEVLLPETYDASRAVRGLD